MTGRDVVTASLKLIGAIAPGESLEASEASDGLAVLNRMIASWSTESLFIYAWTSETFTLVANQQTYTMGTGGDFNTSRPLAIDKVSLRVNTTSPSFDLPVKMLSVEEWAGVSLKGITSNIPAFVYADNAYPLTSLSLWPIPTAAYTLVIYSSKQLTQIATLDTALAFPPGYEEALIYNLAIRLAPEYGKAAPAEVATIALESQATIKRLNHKPIYLKCDAAVASRPAIFDWRTGDVR